jgi:hypothetical protein
MKDLLSASIDTLV